MAVRAAHRKEGLKVLDKTLRVLDLFTSEAPEWTTTAVANHLGLPMASAHRIVRSLESHSYLMRTESGAYRLGVGAVDLGRRALATVDVRAAVRPVLQRLARETDETVLLSVYDDERHAARTIDRIETHQPLRLSLEIGRLTPLHAGASSKAMLAYLDHDVIEEVLARPLEALAPHTITDPARLRDELELTRNRGWALSMEETDVGAWGAGAPILSTHDRLLAVLGLAAPTVRHSPENVERFATLLVEASTAAAALLDPRRPDLPATTSGNSE